MACRCGAGANGSLQGFIGPEFKNTRCDEPLGSTVAIGENGLTLEKTRNNKKQVHTLIIFVSKIQEIAASI